MKAAVLLNASAGLLSASEVPITIQRVRDAFQRSHLEAEIQAVRQEDLPAAARNAAASQAHIVVLGGGDGTLSTGAAALVGGRKPLGILPLGSLNHFAKDLGIPQDLDHAVATIARGRVTQVDVGEANDRIFLNNSSIGLYPSAVAHREELRHRRHEGKWLAMFDACVDVLRRFPLLDLTLQVEDRAIALTTPFIFVGNNRYEMSLFSPVKRTSLQRGELSLYVARNGGRAALLRLALRALLGRLEQERDFRSFGLQRIEIRSRRRTLRVALDGEIAHMTSPIRYAIKPRALNVLAPAPDAQAAAS